MGTIEFESGAQRCDDAEDARFDLIHPLALLRIAKIAKEGTKYVEMNYELGIPVHVCLNHMKHHSCQFEMGDRSEDHLAKIAFNAIMAMISLHYHPELSEGYLRGPGGELTDAIKRRISSQMEEARKKREAQEMYLAKVAHKREAQESLDRAAKSADIRDSWEERIGADSATDATANRLKSAKP